MKPFEKYTFQCAKNVFEDETQATEKWIKPALDSGATLCVSPLCIGKKAALHKRGRDFYMQIDGVEEDCSKEMEHIISDFNFVDDDFVLEGSLTGDEGCLKSFSITDILYHKGSDLTSKPLWERQQSLHKNFGDLSGYHTLLVPAYSIETESEFKKFLTDHKGSFIAGIDESFYTEGCPSNQWCAVGKGLVPTTETKKSKTEFDLKDWELWKEKIQKGVQGQFTVHESNGQYKLLLKTVRPFQSDLFTGVTFESIDKSTNLKRQFEEGNQFVVGFTKHRSPSPLSTSVVDRGNFSVLKSTDESTVIDFDGSSNVLKGIYNVDGVSKHNFKDEPQVPTDLVYQLSYSEVNAVGIDKKLNITWYGIEGVEVSKNIHAIEKQGEEEQFVFGEVLVPEDTDAHGDIYDDEEVRFAAHFFMEKFANVGLMHEMFINDEAKIVETFIAPVNMTLKCTDGSTRKIKKGTWLMGMKILSKRLWEDVKAGRLTGFSIGGIATVQELKKLIKAYFGR
jgi:hypothetical protein